jgi:type VI secretion system secreted protein VgrG
MEIITPLGEDVLLFHRMHAREELSRSSEFYLELLGDPQTVINLDDILGQNVTVKITLQDGSQRYFNGFVSRFSAGGRHGRYLRYTATVSPWPWFLTRTSDCRIFQEMTVREILEEVFADHPMADFKFDLTETYEKWTYCVQYRETDFNFVSRLLEHEGIYYYYKHIDGGHTMVLTDSIDKHEPFPGYEALRFIRPQELVRPDLEHLFSWEFSREVQPGVFSLDDYDFERPSVDLRLQRPTPRGYTPSDYEWFDYPGLFTKKPRGEQLAQVRGDEFGSRFERAVAIGNARGVSVGSIFTLEGFPREDQNGKHLVVSSVHDLEFSEYEAMPDQGGSDFRCRFETMTTTQTFRPQRLTPKPFVQGPQTAMVVGPAGEEIYTDNHGRVKVQFHWDSRGGHNEQSSCWIRVSHPWAGKGWGSVSTPRIGQEVIVDFLEGDPDQPIITGRVYNAEQPPPFGFPAGAVTSGLKSNTHKGKGYNEMSMDDTAGKEKITIHGQYDMNTTVEHDQTDTINNNRTTTVVVDDTEDIGSNQKIAIGVDRSLDVGSNDTISVGANQKISVSANQDVSVGANRSITISANDETSAAANMKQSAGVNMALAAGVDLTADGGVNVKISGGATVDVAAGATIKLSAAGSSIEIGPAGINITSPALVTVMGSTIKLN